uniref:Syntaxin 6/10/61 N-terminal domain-containing protein n=1 Tax=Oryza punctata TaxID=4537 RepID=A0A0E0KAA9_ORYPU
MATSFDRWEKDPFFPAAEEVQGSADRMESVYRIWMQDRSGGDSEAAAAAVGGGGLPAGELRRELHTALGTAKWQLDELERAIRSNDKVFSAGKDTKARHEDFVAAIGCRILEVENNLKESNVAEGRGALSWIDLDEDERNDLAAFLSASSFQQRDKVVTIPSAGDIEVGNNAAMVKKDMYTDSSKDSGSAELSSARVKEETHRGHRRAASAHADIGSWTMLCPNESESSADLPYDGQHQEPLLKIVKTCALTSALQSKPRTKKKGGSVKWAAVDQQDVEETIPLSSQMGQGSDRCFERSKSCVSTCDESTYNKKLYGWFGALHRRLQRSQYRIRYGRPVQLIVLAVATLLICT